MRNIYNNSDGVLFTKINNLQINIYAEQFNLLPCYY